MLRRSKLPLLLLLILILFSTMPSLLLVLFVPPAGSPIQIRLNSQIYAHYYTFWRWIRRWIAFYCFFLILPLILRFNTRLNTSSYYARYYGITLWRNHRGKRMRLTQVRKTPLWSIFLNGGDAVQLSLILVHNSCRTSRQHQSL